MASLSGVYNLQILDSAGELAAGHRLYTYAAGTTTQKTAYTDAGASAAHTYTSDGIGGQYIALNSRGELPAPLFLATGNYDLTLKTAAGSTVWTRRAAPIDDSAASIDAAIRGDIADDTSATEGTALIGHLPPGAGAVGSTLRDHLNRIVYADNYSTIQQALDQAAAIGGADVWLTPGESYTLTTRLLVASGCGIVSDGTAELYAPASVFANTNPTSKFTATSAVIDCSGLTSSPFTANTNIRLKGFKIRSQVSDGRMVDAITARNINGLEIVGVEAYGFPVGYGIRAATLTGRVVIAYNYFHDFTNAAAIGATAQSGGVELDNDKVNSTPSYGVNIVGNRIKDIVFTGSALSTYGMQTDGINIQGNRASPAATDFTRGHVVTGNIISNVGEGIDTFGWYSTISNNTIDTCYYTCIKLIHGASYNTVAGNILSRAKLCHIMLAASTGGETTCDLAGNRVTGNVCVDANYLNDGGSDPRLSCIRTENTAGTNQVTDNLVSGNILDPGDYGKYCIYRQSDGLRNDFVENKLVRKGTVGWTLDDHGETGRMTASNGTRFRGTMSAVTSIAASSVFTKLNINTAAIDDRAELDSTNNAWQCQIQGRYRVKGRARFATIAADSLIQLQIRLDGSVMSTESAQTSTSNEAVVTVEDIITVTETGRIQLFAAQSTGGAINAQTADTYLIVEQA